MVKPTHNLTGKQVILDSPTDNTGVEPKVDATLKDDSQRVRPYLKSQILRPSLLAMVNPMKTKDPVLKTIHRRRTKYHDGALSLGQYGD